MNKKLYFYLFVTIFLFLGAYIFNGNSKNVSAHAIPVTSGTIYPLTNFTTGTVFPNATVAQICALGYTKTVRNVPIALKQEVFTEYGISYPQPKGAFEVDHFIPLELGGSNDITNLWPESKTFPGFHEKDTVENYLHDAVCNGNISLPQAQQEIRTDWYNIYLQIQK